MRGHVVGTPRTTSNMIIAFGQTTARDSWIASCDMSRKTSARSNFCEGWDGIMQSPLSSLAPSCQVRISTEKYAPSDCCDVRADQRRHECRQLHETSGCLSSFAVFLEQGVGCIISRVGGARPTQRQHCCSPCGWESPAGTPLRRYIAPRKTSASGYYIVTRYTY